MWKGLLRQTKEQLLYLLPLHCVRQGVQQQSGLQHQSSMTQQQLQPLPQQPLLLQPSDGGIDLVLVEVHDRLA